MKSKWGGHWTHQLFVEKPYLFLPFLLSRKKQGVKDAATIASILKGLGVKRGGRILDLCCGIGRVAVPLAKKGFKVVGVDLSPDYIRRARNYARSREVSARTKFAVGDYRQIGSAIAKEEPFNGVLSAYTSTGYYGKEADASTFSQLAKHTVKGGVFVLETVNRDWLVRHFEQKGWQMAGEVLVLEDRRFDAERAYMVNKWEYFRVIGANLIPEGVYEVDHRVYSPAELGELMESTGWKVRSIAMNLEGDPIDLRSPTENRLVMVARRK